MFATRITCGQELFLSSSSAAPAAAVVEALNRHSFLYGNDPADTGGEQLRGQRVYCSSRGQRGGCGQTFSIFLADVLPRHSVTATWLWKLFRQLLGGASLKQRQSNHCFAFRPGDAL